MITAITDQSRLNEIEEKLKKKLGENQRTAEGHKSAIRAETMVLLFLATSNIVFLTLNLADSISTTLPDPVAMVLFITLKILDLGAFPIYFMCMLTLLKDTIAVADATGYRGEQVNHKTLAPWEHDDIIDYIATLKKIGAIQSSDSDHNERTNALQALAEKYCPLEASKQNLSHLLMPAGIHPAVTVIFILLSALFSKPVTNPTMIGMMVTSAVYLTVSAARAYNIKKQHDLFLQSLRDLAAEFGFDREGKQPIQEIVSALNQEIITAVNPVEEPLDSLVSEIKAQGLTFSDQHIKTDTDQIGTNGSLKKKDGFDARPVNHLVL